MKNNIKHLYVKRPCKNCPLTKSCTPNWLGEERITEILESDNFVCHETTGVAGNNPKITKQCAGHLIINKSSNIFYRLAEFYKIDLELAGSERVFDNYEDCIKHHKR